jgi:hypothetical protein
MARPAALNHGGAMVYLVHSRTALVDRDSGLNGPRGVVMSRVHVGIPLLWLVGIPLVCVGGCVRVSVG